MRGRRKPTKIIALIGAVAAAGAIASAAMASDEPADRARRTTSSTVIGAINPSAVACAQAASQGRSSVEALERCNRAINNEPLDRKMRYATHVNRGTIHLRRGEAEAALADFDIAIEGSPGNGDLVINRGAALMRLGRTGDAVIAFTTALQLGPTEPHKAYFNRAVARETMGDLRGALEDYETALAIKPDWDAAEAEVARFVRGRRDALVQGGSGAPTSPGAPARPAGSP